MERSSTVWIDRAARLLLFAVLAMNVYRAATQSITREEAVTFDRWVRPPLRDVIPQYYNSNNHILNSLLIKRAIGLFRLSEFSFRLPSLLGGALYLWAIYRLSRRLLGSGSLFLAGLAVLTLHPALLDYLSAARGHGLGLALWMWSLELALEGRLRRAAVCLGLSPAASLLFLWPAAVLAFGIVAVRRASPEVIEKFAIPALVTGFIVLVIPLSHATLAQFSDGTAASFYLVPIGTLAALTLVGRINSKRVTLLAVIAAGFVTGWYLAQLRFRFYGPWPGDAGARAAISVLRRDGAGREVEIGASRELQPILRFYQARYRLSNWKPLRPSPVDGDFDYFVLAPRDFDLADRRRLEVLYRDSGWLLARNRP